MALQQFEGLIDEYYEAQSLDPSRLPVICDHIRALVLQENLHCDPRGWEVVTDNTQHVISTRLEFLQPC